MNAPPAPHPQRTPNGRRTPDGQRPPDAEALRRRVAHELYQKLAFASFLVWTLGCLILFILYAAGNPRPIPSAALAMTAPLLPALALWVAYRPLVRWQLARRLRSG